jgi:hypothetical protein
MAYPDDCQHEFAFLPRLHRALPRGGALALVNKAAWLEVCMYRLLCTETFRCMTVLVVWQQLFLVMLQHLQVNVLFSFQDFPGTAPHSYPDPDCPWTPHHCLCGRAACMPVDWKQKVTNHDC